MELTGTYSLPLPPEAVWAALFDRDILARAIPGCEELEQTSDTSFTATVKLKIGPVSARFKGDVELSDIEAPNSCTLSGKGSGGVAGFAKGAARVTLEPEGEGTRLSYTAEAAIGGKLASLGGRLIRSSAQKLSEQFFSTFTAILTGAEEALADSSNDQQAAV